MMRIRTMIMMNSAYMDVDGEDPDDDRDDHENVRM